MKAKVAVVRCPDYDQSNLQDALRKALDLIGEAREFSKDSKVLIKPNLLSSRPPESGADTHPEFVRAVIKVIKERGASPYVGDSPGGKIRNTDIVYENSGIKKVAREENVELVKFDKAVGVDGYPIAKPVKEADYFINLPKAKTHNLTILTGAIKNVYGVIPGMAKIEFHMKAPDPLNFSKILVQIFKRARPDLSIMDAVIAMEGSGPAAGHLRNLGLILASRDAVALDAVFSKIVGIDPKDIDMVRLACEEGLGVCDLDEIDIVGEKIKDVCVYDFKLPATRSLHRVPWPLLKFLSKRIWFRPAFDIRKCKECMICQEICPVRAITVKDKKVDFDKCIACLCCMEMCPHDALVLKRSLLAKVFTKGWRLR